MQINAAVHVRVLYLCKHLVCILGDLVLAYQAVAAFNIKSKDYDEFTFKTFFARVEPLFSEFQTE